MFANYFLLKLILAPVIIAGASLIARRWGDNIGGLIIGLPWTSAPLSIFFAIEQGTAFAANAAHGAMLGLLAVAVFCIAYVRFARRFAWQVAALLSILAYLVIVWITDQVTIGFWASVIIIPAGLGLALLLIGKPAEQSHPIPPQWWDLPLRMFVATALLIGITTAASSMGPKWSGLLSPFPIFTFVMATFAHSQGGSTSAWRLIRGVIMGIFAYFAFFLVVSLLIQQTSLWITYLLAAIAALGFNGMAILRSALKEA
jgi:hypothetical protein